MKKDNKKILFERFEKVNNVNLKEWMEEETNSNSNWSFKTEPTNKELRTFIAELLFKLKHYEQPVMIDILTSALENKYPQLKQL
jgi:UDP-N-acetylenolpyruvoylglucosamine reductase